MVNYAEKNKKNLDELNLNEIKKFYKDLDIKVLKIFNVKNSMNSKNSFGGTSEKILKSMIKKYKRNSDENIALTLILLIFVLTACGKKSDPQYQGSTNNLISII